MEDLTKQYTQDTQDSEQQDDLDKLDLSNKDDLDYLINETTGGRFFQPEDGKKYKIRLTSSKVEPVLRTFTKINKETGQEYPDQQKKWIFSVQIRDKEGNEVEKLWQVGRETTKDVARLLREQDTPITETTFYLEREGLGINTKYKVYIPEHF